MNRRIHLTYESEQEMRQSLLKVGLSEREAQIFIALCNLGPQPSSIVARNMGMKRTTTYHNLRRMAAKGFVFPSQEASNTYFHLNPLNEAISRLEQEKEEIDEKVECLNKISAQIGQIKQSTNFANVKYREYKGIHEVKRLKMNTIKDQKEVLTYSILNDGEFSLNIKDEKFWKRYRNKISKQKTKIRMIIPSGDITQSKDAPEGDDPSMVKVKAVPEALFPLTDMLEMNILEDRVIVIGDHFGIEIESKQIADLQRSAFELAWMGAQIIDANRLRAEKSKEFYI